MCHASTEKFTTTHIKNSPPKYIVVWTTPILWSVLRKRICLLNPNTIAQKVSMQHVGMLLNHYPKLLLSIFVWIFGNLISWHYIPKGARYGCCWPSGYGNNCLTMSRPFSTRWAKHGWPCAHNYELSKLPCFLWWWFQYDLGFKILLLGGSQFIWTWMCYGVPYPCYQSFWPIKGHQMLNPWSSHEFKLPHLSY